MVPLAGCLGVWVEDRVGVPFLEARHDSTGSI